MHVRPPTPAEDFALLSPLDPFASLGDYQCGDKLLHSFFCRNCGVRCVNFMGEGHIVEAQAGTFGLEGEAAVKVWRPTGPSASVNEKKLGCYLSVNGHTIEAGQEGFDMRELVDSDSVMYYDFLREGEKREPARYTKPYPGGCY